jgi:hypothetical protein
VNKRIRISVLVHHVSNILTKIVGHIIFIDLIGAQSSLTNRQLSNGKNDISTGLFLSIENGLSRNLREDVSALIDTLGESTLAMTGNIKHVVSKYQNLPFRTFAS